MRQEVLALPHDHLGEIQHHVGEEFRLRGPQRNLHCLLGKWISFSRNAVGCPDFRQRRSSTESIQIAPEEAIGFTWSPGPGCESASFFLNRYPKWVGISGRGRNFGQTFRRRIPVITAWTYAGFCKTAYSNRPEFGGPVHFLKCHLTIIAGLDAARRIGIQVTVVDESGFEVERSLNALLAAAGLSSINEVTDPVVLDLIQRTARNQEGAR